jgi:hypothetical protein
MRMIFIALVIAVTLAVVWQATIGQTNATAQTQTVTCPDGSGPLTRYEKTICVHSGFAWFDNNGETFVIGAQYYVWYITPVGANPKTGPTWKTLGGNARKTPPNGAYRAEPNGVACIAWNNKCYERVRQDGVRWSSWRLSSACPAS